MAKILGQIFSIILAGLLHEQKARICWKFKGNNRIVLSDAGSSGLKIFGMLWMFCGVLLINGYVIRPMVEYIQAAGAGWMIALQSNMPMVLEWLVMFILLAYFFIPLAWVWVFMKRKVVVDAAQGEIEEVRDFFLFRRRKVYSLREFAHVVLKKSESAAPIRDEYGRMLTTLSYIVRLTNSDLEDPIPIASSWDYNEAEKFGQALAKVTRLPFQTQD